MKTMFTDPGFYLRTSPAASTDASRCVVASRTVYPTVEAARDALDAVLDQVPAAKRPLELTISAALSRLPGTGAGACGFRIGSAGAAETLPVALQVEALCSAARRITRQQSITDVA